MPASQIAQRVAHLPTWRVRRRHASLAESAGSGTPPHTCAQEGGILKITPFDILAIFSAFYLASRLARHLFPRFLGREIPAKKVPVKKAQ